MAYPFADPQFLPRRALTVSGILALHAVVAFFLVTGLIHAVTQVEPQPMTGFVSLEPRPGRPPAPAATPRDFTKPRISLEPVAYPVPRLVRADEPHDNTPRAGDAIPVPAPAAAPAEPLRVLGRHQMPNTEDYYPPDLRRLGVEGASYVLVCVDAGGLRAGEPAIEQSSGNARLDLGALNVARHGRYARSVQGGVGVPNCYHFRVAFKMK